VTEQILTIFERHSSRAKPPAERVLWKSLKYEEVYLHAYEIVSAARGGISKCFAFYNAQRPHTALDRKPPDHVYFKAFPALPLAAAA
jgi:putative transposase